MSLRRSSNRTAHLLIGALLLPAAAAPGHAQGASAGPLLDRLSARVESLRSQLETLETRVRTTQDWSRPCCAATTRVMRGTVHQARSTLATLRAGFRQARHDRGLALVAELSAQARTIEAALAALDRARSAGSAQAAVGRASHAIATFRQRLDLLRTCCYDVRW